MKEKEAAAFTATDQQQNVDSQESSFHQHQDDDPDYLYHPALTLETLHDAEVQLGTYGDQHGVLIFPHFDTRGTPTFHASFLLPEPENGSHWKSGITDSEAFYFPPEGLREEKELFLVSNPVEVLVLAEAGLQAIGLPELKPIPIPEHEIFFQSRDYHRLFSDPELSTAIGLSKAESLFVLAPARRAPELALICKLQTLSDCYGAHHPGVVLLPLYGPENIVDLKIEHPKEFGIELRKLIERAIPVEPTISSVEIATALLAAIPKSQITKLAALPKKIFFERIISLAISLHEYKPPFSPSILARFDTEAAKCCLINKKTFRAEIQKLQRERQKQASPPPRNSNSAQETGSANPDISSSPDKNIPTEDPVGNNWENKVDRESPLSTIVIPPSADRLVSDFAAELAPILSRNGFYNYHGNCVIFESTNSLEDSQLINITPQRFIGLIERYVNPLMLSRQGTGTYTRYRSLSADIAAATLVDLDFLKALPPLVAVNRVRLPVWSKNGSIRLLPLGYDQETAILTDPADRVSSDKILEPEEAKKFFTELFSEINFAEGDRARGEAVQLSMMETFFCRHLLKAKALRPGILYSANHEGAGKTTLAYLDMIPVLGYAPTGNAPEKNDEMQKLIFSTLCDGKPALFLDNTKNRLSFPALEAFMTAIDLTERILCTNHVVTLPNNLVVVITGNGCSISGDLRRRVLQVELFLNEARAEDHCYKNPLGTDNIIQLRPEILRGLFTTVYTWADAKCPSPKTRTLLGYDNWNEIIGGMVNHAGKGPLQAEPQELKFSGDRDIIDMEKLVSLLQCGADYSFGQLVGIMQQYDLFSNIVSKTTDLFDTELSPSAKSILGKILGHRDGQLFRFQDPQTGIQITRRFYARGSSKHGKIYGIRLP